MNVSPPDTACFEDDVLALLSDRCASVSADRICRGLIVQAEAGRVIVF
jgi:hypothetical protein